MRAAALFSRLEGGGEKIDRCGSGNLAEVYPAAALKIWGFPSSGYKGSKGSEARRRLLKEIEANTHGWLDVGDVRFTLERNDDALDALIAALVARAAALSLCETIPAVSLSRAQREGWIAIPLKGSLDRLA
jgi:hypothetical protein